jgi:periplasmic protein TonB
MFESATLDTASNSRSATTFSTSLLLQTGLVGGFVCLSLLAPIAYPEVPVISISPPAPRFRDAVRVIASAVAPRSMPSERPPFFYPVDRPRPAQAANEAIFSDQDLPAVGLSDPTMGGITGGNPLPVSQSLPTEIKPFVNKPFVKQPDPPETPAPPQRITRGGDVQAASILHRVTPIYPPLARQARIQGSVVMQAIINRDGRIANLRVVSGHPLLVKSALDAVQQWVYRPTYLNGNAVEVDAPITVNFILGQ